MSQSQCTTARYAAWTLIKGIVVVGVLHIINLPAPCGAQQDVPGPDDLRLLPGFRAELVYKVPAEFGSWVSLTTYPKGLIASDQYGKLYRIDRDAQDDEFEVGPIDVRLGRAQGLLWAFDSLYAVSNAGDGQPAGLYRVTDETGDGKLDTVKLLRQFEGGGEHGPHAVILGPDKESLFVCAGNHTQLPDIQSSRVPRNWNEDHLLPRMWDPGGHAVGITAPGGWICKTDPEGKSFELVSIGFRNEYDIAFDPSGELFTFDADMEWDIGTPWYRPTRVCHVTSGSEFGWRSGNAKWPSYYPDSVPAAVDIGPGSPTGVVFGTGSRFPEKYQRAFFIADWSFSFIYAVHLTPDGGTFGGEAEVFCAAPALQVTDMIVDPTDGALYFAIGGRRTQSALYRIVSEQPMEPTAVVATVDQAQQLRREIEELHLQRDPKLVDQVWQYLSHPDRSIRYAARIVIEHQPVQQWLDRALQEESPQALLEALTALARCAPQGHQGQALSALGRLNWQSLSREQRLHLIRNYGLALMRLGAPTNEVLDSINQRLSSHFPSSDELENRELTQLLIATAAPQVIQRTLQLLQQAHTQEEQIHYVMSLRAARLGWTTELRKQYLQWFAKGAAFQGGNSFTGYLRNARDEFIRQLDAKESELLGDLIAETMKERDPYADLKARPIVKKWTVAELLPQAEQQGVDRDLENGKQVFSVAQCYKCHRFNGAGGIVGPDLTGLSRRYTTQYLLETLIEPSKEISDQYQATIFMLDDGRLVTGRVANMNERNYMIQTDMIKPSKFTNVDRTQIEETRPSTVSMMPENLLDSFTEKDILDLLAYLRSADLPRTGD